MGIVIPWFFWLKNVNISSFFLFIQPRRKYFTGKKFTRLAARLRHHATIFHGYSANSYFEYIG